MALPFEVEPDRPVDFGPAPDAITAIEESLDARCHAVVEDGGLAVHRISLLCGGRRLKRRHALCPYGECDTGVTQD